MENYEFNEEKQAYTFWIENRMGRSQTGFFKRYSLQRDSEEILRMQDSDDNMNMDASTFKMVVRLMNAGSLFYDFTTLEFCPTMRIFSSRLKFFPQALGLLVTLGIQNEATHSLGVPLYDHKYAKCKLLEFQE